MTQSYVIYKGSLPSLQRFSPQKRVYVDLLNGIPYHTDDLDLFLQLDGRADFEIKYSIDDIKKMTDGKSISQLKELLKKFGVQDTRELTAKRELIEKIKEIKLI